LKRSSKKRVLDHLGGVILVGGDLETTRRMDLDRADTLDMARDTVGPSTTYMRGL
jgi:hypothetical protein